MPSSLRTFVRLFALVPRSLAPAPAREKDKVADFQFTQIDLTLLDEMRREWPA